MEFVSTLSPEEEDLRRMKTLEVYAVSGATGCLVRRLDGPARWVANLVFIPVEDFVTGERYALRLDLVRFAFEMEILARAAML